MNRKSPIQDTVMSSPTGEKDTRTQVWQSCTTCGRTHPGPCRLGQDVCYKCGQMGHYIKEYPQKVAHPSVPPASQTTVQMERPRDTGPTPTQSFKGKGQARVFSLHPQEVYEPDVDLPGMSFID